MPVTDRPRTFASLLQSCRATAGLTQQQLADFAALSVRAVRDLEHGRAERPRRDTVRLLADALRLDPEQRAEFERAARGRSPAPAGDASTDLTARPFPGGRQDYEYSTILLDSLATDSTDGEWSRALNDMARQAWRLVSVDRGVAFLERSLG
jgi:transcriptional regulator with XRE-family HTH domain